MAGIGIVNNPRSLRNLRSPRTARRLRSLVEGDGTVADASTREELARVIEQFRAQGIDLLAINGGDGTAHVVLTALADAYGEATLPDVVLLRGGGMNVVAHAHRVRGTPEAILRSLLERRRAGTPPRTVERDLLAVAADGAAPQLGFLFGTGAVTAFLDAYYAGDRPRPGRAAALLVRAVGSALVGGRFATALAPRERLRITVDGEDWPEGPFLAVLAGTVPELGFGFEPFGRFDEQPGFFHAVGVTGSAFHLVPQLPRIWLGRPWRRSVAVDAVARDVVVEGGVRFMVDGDLHAARDAVRIRTGPPVRLVLP